MSATRILIVDDNAAMRGAIALLFEDEPDLLVCGQAATITEALQHCEALGPDVALVDLSLKGEDGLDLVRQLKARAPSPAVVVFSLHDEPFYVNAARRAGANGYVGKSEDPLQMLDCVRRVRDGQSRFPGMEPA
jgi:DNA-binding NarL/FixJ family response regulator